MNINFRLSPFIIILIMVLFSGTGCDSNKDVQKKSGENANEQAWKKSVHKLFSSDVGNASALDIENELAFLLVKEGGVILKKGNKEKIIYESKTPSGKVWLHKNEKRLYAIWWTKKGDKSKRLRIKASLDKGATFSEKASFISEKGVLPALTITDDGKDKLAIAYLSERQPGYQVYFNRSLDGGKTWFKQDKRINELYDNKGPFKPDAPLKTSSGWSHVSSPFLSYFGDKLVLVWQETSVFDSKRYLRIVSKTSMDDGNTWGNEQEVFKVINVKPQEMHVNKLGNELFVGVFIPKKGILTFSSVDGVGKWLETGVIPGTEKTVFSSSMSSSLSNDGGKFLSFTRREYGKKDKVKLFVNAVGEKNWLEITEKVIREGKLSEDKGKDYDTKNISSRLHNFNGLLVLVWEDYRYLIPTVLINYSSDNGVTWLKEPVTVTPAGKIITKYPSFVVGDKTLWLLFTLAEPSKNFRTQSQGMYQTKIAELKNDNTPVVVLPEFKKAKVLTKEQKLALLRERSEKFWELRIKEKHDAVFEYFDPLYRTGFGRMEFVSTQGKIKYLTAKTGDIIMHGNIAFVDTEVSLSVTVFQELRIGNEASTPKKRKMKARWGWFYDNWYLMPETIFDERFKY